MSAGRVYANDVRAYRRAGASTRALDRVFCAQSYRWLGEQARNRRRATPPVPQQAEPPAEPE